MTKMIRHNHLVAPSQFNFPCCTKGLQRLILLFVRNPFQRLFSTYRWFAALLNKRVDWNKLRDFVFFVKLAILAAHGSPKPKDVGDDVWNVLHMHVTSYTTIIHSSA